MLNFLKIDNVYDEMFEGVFSLYTESFPKEERRSWAALENVLNSDKRFNLFALFCENNFAGFIAYWKFEHFYFLEHFAILPAYQNKNLGSETIATLLAQVNLPVVLEAEPPKNIEAERRIHFYERLGFSVMTDFYMQPPYDNHSFLIPMIIMCNDFHYAKRHFNAIRDILYSEVYHYKKEAEEG